MAGGNRGNNNNANGGGGNGGGNGGNGGFGQGNGGGFGQGNGGGFGQGNGGGFGQGNGGGFGQGGGGGFGPGGGFGRGGNLTDEQRAQRDQIFASMRRLDKDTELAVLKVLDAKQRTRVSQIKLQSQGLNAFRTPELIAALKIPEVRVPEIAEILNGQNQARRQQFGQMGQVFAQFTGNNGQRPTREQMQALQDNPEFQAKMAETRKKMEASNATLEEQTKAQVARLLTKKQRDQYDKMLGEEFDITKLPPATGRGPGGRNNPTTTTTANADGEEPAAKAATPSTTRAPAATTPAR